MKFVRKKTKKHWVKLGKLENISQNFPPFFFSARKIPKNRQLAPPPHVVGLSGAAAGAVVANEFMDPIYNRSGRLGGHQPWTIGPP